MKNRIICINANPCIDKNIIGGNITMCYAGKGANVARYLSTLSHSVELITILPSADIRGYVESFEGSLIKHHIIEVNGSLRVNLKTMIGGELKEETTDGFCVDEEITAEVLKKIGELASGSAAVVASGSLPKGMDNGFYREAGKLAEGKFFLDAKGEPLKIALSALPFMIKPNREEFEQLVGERVNVNNIRALIGGISEKASNVLLSLGSGGAVLCREGEVIHGLCKTECINSVGAGDSMVAMAVHCFLNDMNGQETLKRCVAFSAAKVMGRDIMELKMSDYADMLDKIEVKYI